MRTQDTADNEIKFYPTHLEYIRWLANYFQYSTDKAVWVPKSRRLMLTWTKTAHMVWQAMFTPAYHGFIQSNKEKDADFLVQEMARFIWEHLPVWMRWVAMRGEPTAHSKWLELNLPNGSKIWGVPQGPDVFRQYTPSEVFVDEAAKQPEFEKAVTAIMPFAEKNTRLYFVSSARSDYQNAYFGEVVESEIEGQKEFPLRGIQTWKLKHGGSVLRVHYTADPVKDPEREGAEWIAEQDVLWEGGLAGWKWRQEMEIDFGATSGELIFDNFDEQSHVIPPFEIPKDAPRWRVIDWGFRNPTAVLWIAEVEGIYFAYREFYEARTDIEAFKFQMHFVGLEEEYEATWIDPSADRTNAEGMDTVYKLLNQEPYKLNAWKANRDRSGLELIRKWLQEGRYKVFNTLPNHIHEIKNYRFQDPGDGRTAALHNPKEAPVKRNDHTCDALKYFANGVTLREQKRLKSAAKPPPNPFNPIAKVMAKKKKKKGYRIGDPAWVRNL